MIIIDSESCINKISSGSVSHLDLKFVSRPKLYNMSWVNNISITIKKRCIFLIKILDYCLTWMDVTTGAKNMYRGKIGVTI